MVRAIGDIGSEAVVWPTEVEVVRHQNATTPVFDPYANDPKVVQEFGDDRDTVAVRVALGLPGPGPEPAVKLATVRTASPGRLR